MIFAAAPFALVAGLALASLAASLATLFFASRIAHSSRDSAAALRQEYEGALRSLRLELEGCNREVQAIRAEAPPAPTPMEWRPGLNLNKRSQALRMNRRGENPEQIAVALSMPRQEVDLLLKVHRMVIRSL